MTEFKTTCANICFHLIEKITLPSLEMTKKIFISKKKVLQALLYFSDVFSRGQQNKTIFSGMRSLFFGWTIKKYRKYADAQKYVYINSGRNENDLFLCLIFNTEIFVRMRKFCE